MKYDLSRQLPNAVDIERNIIGAILLDKEAVNIAMEILTEECFYSDANAAVFKAIQSLWKRKDPVDLTTLVFELKKMHQLEILGGAYAVTSYTENVASSANIEAHCRIVAQCFIKRKIISLTQDIHEKAFDEYFDSLSLLDIFSLESKKLYDNILQGRVTSIIDTYNETMQANEAARANNGIVGMSTGIQALDAMIMGLEPGLKYTIAGRPGMGKTSLLKTIACNMAERGNPGALFLLEISRTQFMNNIISGVCEINSEKLKKGLFSDQEKMIIDHKMKNFPLKNLFVDDSGAITAKQIRSAVKRLKKLFGIKWFGVDFIQLVKTTNEERRGKLREEIVSDITYEMKNIAKEEDVACIELAQLSRAVESESNKRPNLSHLKDSGAIEAASDVVMFLYRPEYYGYETIGPGRESAKGVAEIIIAKQRNGPTGSVLTKYIAPFTKFTNRENEPINPQLNINNQLDDF